MHTYAEYNVGLEVKATRTGYRIGEAVSAPLACVPMWRV